MYRKRKGEKREPGNTNPLIRNSSPRPLLRDKLSHACGRCWEGRRSDYSAENQAPQKEEGGKETHDWVYILVRTRGVRLVPVSDISVGSRPNKPAKGDGCPGNTSRSSRIHARKAEGTDDFISHNPTSSLAIRSGMEFI